MVDPVQHIVILMLENHSFDQLLGSFQGTVYADLDGIDLKNVRANIDPQTGTTVSQTETRETAIALDPPHEFVDVARQLANGNGGFIASYMHAHPDCTADEKQQIMSYYPADYLPILHKLARNLTVCDRWFSSMPGPTWPNRFFVHSGTCKEQ
jgi:phospholipase C